MFTSSEVRDFHPLYRKMVELGYDIYFQQQFIKKSNGNKIELVLSSDSMFFSPENNLYEPLSEEEVECITSVHLNFIGLGDKIEKGQGEGTKMLEDFCSLLDELKVDCYLDIQADFGVSYNILKKWYEKHGFVFVKDSEDEMVRLHK